MFPPFWYILKIYLWGPGALQDMNLALRPAKIKPIPSDNMKRNTALFAAEPVRADGDIDLQRNV